MHNLNLELERRDGYVYVRLSGDLDMAEAQSLEAELRRVEEERPPLVVLDLSALDFIDSFGIRALIETQRRAQADGRRLALVPARETIQEIFRVTLLDRRFEWIEAPAEEDPPAEGPAAAGA